MPKSQLDDVAIEISQAKKYGMAYAILSELEKFLEKNKEYIKSEIIGAFHNIPDDERVGYERSVTLAGIKFTVSIPMAVDKIKLKDYLKSRLPKKEFQKAVTVTPTYTIDKEKLMANRAVLRKLIDERTLVRHEDNFIIHDDIVDGYIRNGVLTQAEIDDNCKAPGPPSLRVSGAGLNSLKRKANDWVSARFG